MHGGQNRLTEDEFIRRAKRVHGNKYQYPDVNYSTLRKPVNVYCPVHGEFTITAANFLAGRECKKCKNGCRVNTESFISRAEAVHGAGTYDYSCTHYIKAGVKVDIICKIHGQFSVLPHSFLSGVKCGKCGHIQAGAINHKRHLQKKQKNRT
ncbi:hypothetical protein IOC47_23135 [Enterobacter cloacae]|uniref:hypothetical protein n=1 Tax=Enterobacter cloacae complex TaxID=354276 RepID=UPI001E61577E|nr:hypothetical protein [Enterobacter cloacae]MCD1394698.1 hypothetical protein [Enterobacter cloacae]